MSGASEVYSAAQMAEKQRVQAMNAAVQRRIRESSGNGATKVDLAARHEEKPTLSGRPKPMHSAFTPEKSSAKMRAEQDAAIAMAREAVKVRAMNGPDAAPTSVEKGEKPKREKREKAPKPEKAAKPEKCSEKAPEKELSADEKWTAYFAKEAAKLEAIEGKKIAFSYDLPGIVGETFVGKCEPGQFPAIARDLCRNGTRRVTPAEGYVVTLIHCRVTRDPVTGLVTEAEYAVGRRYVTEEIKGHEIGAKALASGLPRTVPCPDCKGMGRVVDSYRGKDCPKCDAKGTLPGDPIEVHAYHVSRDVVRAGPRGVMAMDRPLSGEPIVPSRKRGAICTGGKPASGVWQSRAKTTRVTISGG